MTLLLAKYWKQLLIVVLLVAALLAAYDKVYTMGYTAAEKAHKEYVAEYMKSLDTRVFGIETRSNTLIEEFRLNRELSKKDFNKILLATRGKPLFTITEGKCSPSNDFVDAYNAAIKRANGK